jgi:hypothetical protein
MSPFTQNPFSRIYTLDLVTHLAVLGKEAKIQGESKVAHSLVEEPGVPGFQGLGFRVQGLVVPGFQGLGFRV